MKRFLLYAVLALVLPMVGAIGGTMIGLRLALPRAKAETPQTNEPPMFGVVRDKIPPGEHYIVKGVEFAPPFQNKNCIRVMHVLSGPVVPVECRANDWIYLVRPEK